MNIQDGMNIVDVLAIMPYYVSLFLITDDLSPGKKEEGGGMHIANHESLVEKPYEYSQNIFN